jgi:NADH dehydrogenase
LKLLLVAENYLSGIIIYKIMTEHGASIFVFFFLAEYANIILMSTLLSIFFLGGGHCPDLHKLIYEPIMYTYYYIYTHVYNIINIDNVIKDNNNNDNINIYKELYNEKDFHLNNFDNYNNLNNIEETINIELVNQFYNELVNTVNIFRSNNKINVFDVDKEVIAQFTNKDVLLNTLSLLIDKIQGSYILGFKIIGIVFLFIWVRASFPRLRYDQLMSLCWKELLPLVFAYIIFTLCLFYTFDMMPDGLNF